VLFLVGREDYLLFGWWRLLTNLAKFSLSDHTIIRSPFFTNQFCSFYTDSLKYGTIEGIGSRVEFTIIAIARLSD